MSGSQGEQIIFNALVWTGRESCPERRTLLLGDGRLIAINPSDGVPERVKRIDCGGRIVTPGFIDAHVHLTLGSETMLHVDLSDVRSREAFEEVIAVASRNPQCGGWLIASGWDDTRFESDGMPSGRWLTGAGDVPVVCWRCDWHAAVVNDAALSRLTIPESDPPGGRIVRDETGDPTGLLVESAAWHLLNPIVPRPSEQERLLAVADAGAALLRAGVTSVRSMEYRRDVEEILMVGGGGPAPRTSIVLLDRDLPLDLTWVDSVAPSSRLRITGCKAFFDGTLGSRTARLRDPYADDPENSGLWVEHAMDGTDLAWARQVVDAGLVPAVHAIGDAALSRALDVDDALGRPGSLVVEHAEVVARADLGRLSDRWLSVQPVHRRGDAEMSRGRLGDRASMLLPLRSMAAYGGRLRFGTDWPIVPFDPMETIRAAVSGTDAQERPFFTSERLNPLDAMRAAVSGDAATLGCEPGLAPGSPADFLVWEGDPLRDPLTARVQATFMDGTLVAGAM